MSRAGQLPRARRPVSVPADPALRHEPQAALWINHVLIAIDPFAALGADPARRPLSGIRLPRAQRVRAVMEQTLARAATTANALADLPGSLRDADDARLELARRWMGPEDDRVFVVARGASWMRASPETPHGGRRRRRHGRSAPPPARLYVRGDGLWLAASPPVGARDARGVGAGRYGVPRAGDANDRRRRAAQGSARASTSARVTSRSIRIPRGPGHPGHRKRAMSSPPRSPGAAGPGS